MPSSILVKDIFLRILIYAIIFVVYVRLVEHFSLFYPSKKIRATPKDIGLEYEDIFFTTQDSVKINGWLIKCSGARSTILISHGNAGNNSDRLQKIMYFYKMGLNVFCFDYRGFGKSEGWPTEAGIYKDVLAAYDYLVKRPDLDSHRIISYGESLGGAVAVDLANKRAVMGIILDSTFSCARDVAGAKLPFIPPFLIETKLDSLSKISSVKVPKLFIHSLNDEVIPYKLGKKLYTAAPAPKEFLEIQGTHNESFFDFQAVYVKGIYEFLKQWNMI